MRKKIFLVWKSHGASADGPDYFEMITPDNKTITLGGDANMKALGSNVTLLGALAR
ncbi:MAG: hypothetical protein IPK03_15480 [Bacteroidetes bacterium]|nr:hypothetical protein [Bacteroidota bacterium]